MCNFCDLLDAIEDNQEYIDYVEDRKEEAKKAVETGRYTSKDFFLEIGAYNRLHRVKAT